VGRGGGLDPAFAVADENDLVIRRCVSAAAEQAVLHAMEVSSDGPADLGARVAGLVERVGLSPLVDQVQELAALRTECDLNDYLDPARTFGDWAGVAIAAQTTLWAAARADEELRAFVEELATIPCNDPGDRIGAAGMMVSETLPKALTAPSPRRRASSTLLRQST